MSESMPWWGWVALVALIPVALVAPVAFAMIVTKAEKWMIKRKQLSVAGYVFVVLLLLWWLASIE